MLQLLPLPNPYQVPLQMVSEEAGVEARTHTPSFITVPSPHLSSRTHTPSWRTVPSPHLSVECIIRRRWYRGS